MSRSRSIEALAKVQGRHRVGNSTYLNVVGNSACWEYRFKANKKVYTRSLGSYFARNGEPPVTLSLVKDKIAAIRLERRNGMTVTPVANGVRTFEQAANEFINVFKAADYAENPKLLRTHKNQLAHAATLNPTPVTQITPEQVAAVVRPLWHMPTGNRVRSLIERVLYSVTLPHENPALLKRIEAMLPTVEAAPVHRPPMPWQNVPAFYGELAKDGRVQCRALRFIILTAARLNEVLGAKWSEIDLAAGRWNIPGSRMKERRDHTVPLTAQMIDLLGTPGAPGDLIFPNSTGGTLARQTVSKLMDGHPSTVPGLDSTVHGMRGSFRTWATETKQHDTAAELCLSHIVATGTRKAYDRAALLPERLTVLTAWSNFVTG
jgi:integrase